jgi:5-methylcytosine-specific restriction enzyme A
MPPKLSLLTSADAVKAAISECDRLGRDPFLKKYGYKYSRLYPLDFNGRVYDSKAIVGVAFGKQHGTPLKSKEFSGGLARVVPLLRKLGFPARETPHPATCLVVGKTYLRKNLLETFGGQLQRGIWTPQEFPVVFLFSGESGKPYGYEDGWTDTGVFRYTGEGQEGDMTFTGGNKSIRDHRQNGKDLLLFMDRGKGHGVRFEGLFECASWEEVEGQDKHRNPRKLIVFDLVPVTTVAGGADPPELGERDGPPPHASLEVLRQAAYGAATTPKAQGKTRDAKRLWYERSAKVRDYVLARARGICEACDGNAPFCKRDGNPYLEPHHTTRLADQGPDHPVSVGAICPTCHRRIHSGLDGKTWNQRLQQRLKEKEQEIEISGKSKYEEHR